MNLLAERRPRLYLYGEWSKLAIKEANRFCEVNVAASSEGKNFTSRRAVDLAARPAVGLRALHLERDHRRVEFHWIPETGRSRSSPTLVSLPLEPLDVSRFA